ncbi:MAG: ArnT family glycosyltransferase, partial [Vicinamibacteria bacterium]
FYPRIDWRGDGPGYVEMEFPIFPWLIAALYEEFGLHEVLGRLLALSFSVLGLVVFHRFATRLLSEFAASMALLFFALSPLPIHLGSSLQPDGLMFVSYLIAVFAFYRWAAENSRWHYWAAMIATALAILAKAPAAHIGVLFAVLLYEHRGARFFFSARPMLFAVVSLVPAALWYRHAHGLWMDYGNSLGVSNGYHWVGTALFTDPGFAVGILRQEILFVWTETGWILGVVAVLFFRSHRVVKLCIPWLVAIAAFYLLSAGSAAELWARYYHVVSVAPAALLFGLGSQAVRDRFVALDRPKVLALSAAFLALGTVFIRRVGMVGNLTSGDRILPAHLGWVTSLFGLAALTMLFAMRRRNAARTTVPALILLYAFMTAFFLELHQISYLYVGQSQSPEYQCAKEVLAPAVREGALIVVSGGGCWLPDGTPGAYNASYFFYWLDRKGFNVCIEEQSLEKLEQLRKRGAEYFVAEEWALDHVPALETELESKLGVLRRCKATLLFRLKT